MHCANCGNLLPPQAKVCPNCGTRVPGVIPTSSPNNTPSEQTSHGGFSSFEEAGPTIANSPLPLEKTVRQTPPAAPQPPYPAEYSTPNQPTPQEQFQFPDPLSFPSSPSFSPSPSFPAEQFSQPAQPSQSLRSSQPLQSPQPPLSSQPQMSFGNAMQPPPQPFAGIPSQHYADTTQQDIPVHNQPPYPAMPLQSPPSAAQYMQFGPSTPSSPLNQTGQLGYGGQIAPMGQPGQPGSSWQTAQPVQPVQPSQPASHRRSTGLIIALIAAIVLVIAGSTLVYYIGVARPAQLHAQATATVVTQLTSQAKGTAVAITHATGTAQAQANATTTAVAVATAQVQATMTAYVNMYTQATSGTPALNDQLTQNDSNDWNIYSGNGAACTFTNGALHTTGIGGFCNARSTNFGNFAYQADMMILKGSSSSSAGGLLFRFNSSTLKFYVFGIGPDGSYSLALIQIGSGSNSTFKNLISGFSSAIVTGIHQQNRLGVLARGNTFYLFANNQYITQFNDSNSANGSIGVFGVDNSGGLDISFVNAKVWQA